MQPGLIWWTQIGTSIRFVDAIANTIRDSRSAVLMIPQLLPWKEELYEAVDCKRAFYTGNQQLIRVEWKEDSSPGKFMLDLCTERERTEYWPGKTYAEYFSECESLSLNEAYIWITGIHKKTGLNNWIDFINQYETHSENSLRRITFLIEYDGTLTSKIKLPTIRYEKQGFDCRFFALAAAMLLENTKYSAYQAEMALNLSDGDPFLCWNLIECGDSLLQKPMETTMSVYATMQHGSHPINQLITEQNVYSSCWKAGISHLFPIIEQYRTRFIEAHLNDLRKYLPIRNTQGEQISIPEDLEIGSVWYLVNMNQRLFTPSEVQNIKLCREIRNMLAHMKIVPQSDVENLYSIMIR